MNKAIYCFIYLALPGIVLAQCPEVCAPCLDNSLICLREGLTEIPNYKALNPQKMLLQSQKFTVNVLSISNFSSPSQIGHLSIRTSNIVRIKSYTFSRLMTLQQLDLSENSELKDIDANAFSQLHLKFLKLDNLPVVNFDLKTFTGLSVLSLSIQNSNLLVLPADLIKPISNSLKNLFLNGNLLRTFDSQLRPTFQNLETLQLQGNPFHCDCSLLWLSDILQQQRIKSQPFEGQKEDQPKCVSPQEMRKKFVYTLVNKLRSCLPPKIVRVDISFESNYKAYLSCFADDEDEKTDVEWYDSFNRAMEMQKSPSRIVQIHKQSSNNRYRCKAKNANGLAELDLQFNWMEKPISNYTIPTDSQKNTGILWREVFSLFEMMCAIFGTLIITVALFLAFCCCYGYRGHSQFFEPEKRKVSMKNYSSYERGIYSEAVAYCDTDIDRNIFPPPPNIPPPIPKSRVIV